MEPWVLLCIAGSVGGVAQLARLLWEPTALPVRRAVGSVAVAAIFSATVAAYLLEEQGLSPMLAFVVGAVVGWLGADFARLVQEVRAGNVKISLGKRGGEGSDDPG